MVHVSELLNNERDPYLVLIFSFRDKIIPKRVASISKLHVVLLVACFEKDFGFSSSNFVISE